jgi:hypothetical protein
MATTKHATFVCLDTNILFRFVTQGQPGCELQHFEEIKKLVDSGTITFLLPEVVQLEFQGLISRMEDDFALHSKRIEVALNKHLKAEKDAKNRWNEFDDVVPFLEAKALEWTQTKHKESNGRLDALRSWLDSEKPRGLPLTQEIYFQTMRRILAARFPKRDGRPIGDCCIIESLIDFFRKKPGGQLLLCTDNLQDFAVELGDGKNTLHPLFADSLPPCEVFTTLASLVAFCNEQKEVEEPEPEAVKDAVDREKSKALSDILNREESLKRLDEILRGRDEAIRRASEAIRSPIETMDLHVMPEVARQLREVKQQYDLAGRFATSLADLSGVNEIARQIKETTELFDSSGIARQIKEAKEQYDLAGEFAKSLADLSGINEMTRQIKEATDLIDSSGIAEAARQAAKLQTQLDSSGIAETMRQIKEAREQLDSSGIAEAARQAAELRKQLDSSGIAETMRQIKDMRNPFKP